MSTQALFLNKDPEWKPNFTRGGDHLYTPYMVCADNSDYAFWVFPE